MSIFWLKNAYVQYFYAVKKLALLTSSDSQSTGVFIFAFWNVLFFLELVWKE